MEEMEFNAQRSEGWFQERLGKLTASTIGEIMRKGRGTTFSKSVDGYLMEKIAEKLTGERKIISGDALDWGTQKEELAILRYEKETGRPVTEVGFCPLKDLEDWAGGSPDGMIDFDETSNKYKGIIEVKCPYNSVNHIEALIKGDIPEKAKGKYFAQIQFNMMCTDTDYCDFISYDPRVKGKEIKIVRFVRDYAYCSLLKERLKLVIEKYKEMLEKTK